MWRLSEQTQTLVQQLHDVLSSNWWLLRPGREERIVALLEQIKERGEAAAFCIVARCLFESPKQIKTSASRTIHHLLSLVSPDRLIQLSNTIGRPWGWYISDDWDKLKPQGIFALLVDPDSQAAVLGLLSFHRNGYVRHEAIRRLADEKSGEELQYLLIRQNDWVGIVAEEAQSAIKERLAPNYLPHFIRCLPLVVHLFSFTRHNLSSVIRTVVEMLVRPEHDALLIKVISTSSLPICRAVVRVALEIPGQHRARVIGYGLLSTDAMLRLICAKRAGESVEGLALQEVTTVLQEDQFVPVRREGFSLEAKLNPEAASTIWQRALLDSSASIRELARYSLGKNGFFDAAGFYRRIIAENGISLVTASGLAECGDDTDLVVIRTFLSHRQKRFRVVGLRGIARVAGEQAVDDLVRSLLDVSPSVVHEAKRQLERLSSEAPSEALFAIVNEATGEYARRYAVQLIFDKGKWQSLPWLIRIASLPEESVASLARRLTEAWFSPPLCNRVFTKPTAGQRKAIDEAIQELRGGPGGAFQVKLQGWLQAV